jgi:hypothetical protein
MAYGSRVRRQGRGRPHSPYHARSRSRTEPSVEGTTAARSPAQLTRPARAAILPRGDCHRDVVGALPGRVRTVHVCVRQASDEVRPRRGDAPRRLGRGAIRRRSGSSLRRVSRPLAPTGTDRRSIRTAPPSDPRFDDLYDAFQHERDERGGLPILRPDEARDSANGSASEASTSSNRSSSSKTIRACATGRSTAWSSSTSSNTRRRCSDPRTPSGSNRSRSSASRLRTSAGSSSSKTAATTTTGTGLPRGGSGRAPRRPRRGSSGNAAQMCGGGVLWRDGAGAAGRVGAARRVVGDRCRARADDLPQLGLSAAPADLQRRAPRERSVTEERTATIGNLPPASRVMFLGDVAAVLTPQDHFLLGVDLVKDVRRLEAAYNHAAGVTATFNLNVLAVMKQRARFELRVRSPGVDANGDQREVPPRRS